MKCHDILAQMLHVWNIFTYLDLQNPWKMSGLPRYLVFQHFGDINPDSLFITPGSHDLPGQVLLRCRFKTDFGLIYPTHVLSFKWIDQGSSKDWTCNCASWRFFHIYIYMATTNHFQTYLRIAFRFGKLYAFSTSHFFCSIQKSFDFPFPPRWFSPHNETPVHQLCAPSERTSPYRSPQGGAPARWLNRCR